MNKSESIANLAKALSSFQGEVKQPLKDADNPFFKSKYVPLESVVDAINAVAHKHGLSFTQWAVNDEYGRIGVATMIMHESGEFIEYSPIFMIPEQNKNGVVTPQSIGSAITYAKRYALSAVFGITSDLDDDANEASGNTNNTKPKQAQKEPSKEDIKFAYKRAFNPTEESLDEDFKAFYDKQSVTYSDNQILFFLNKKANSDKGVQQ